MTATGSLRIETCTVCRETFATRDGEPTPVLVHRYTAWREAHAHVDPVGLDAIDPPSAYLEISPPPLPAMQRLSQLRARLALRGRGRADEPSRISVKGRHQRADGGEGC